MQSWSIYHPLKKFQLNSLTDGELAIILATLSTNELYSMWFWREGWPEWLNYTQAHENTPIPTPEMRNGKAPPVPKAAIIQIDDDGHEITQVYRDKAAERALIDRKFPRYDVQIPIEIILHDRVYKTETENISLGGICTIDVLPEWVAGYCTAVVYPKNGEKIEVVCSVVEDQTLETKHRLEIVATAQLDTLKDWMKKQGFLPEKR